ncbi:hypothetical protein N7523_000707 [Penicillium sp. IBT 18751x]|nr:hypothetical protein N7523_000707 [Penicillium sp. IBT 18751x]
MPAAAERDQSGASGLEQGVAAAAGLALGGQVLHRLSRSRSTSAPGAERALDLAPRSLSRPSSPETFRERDESPRGRRSSMARSVTESPTAVPLHFRRPPTSPGLSRAVPVTGSPTAATVSPGSPTQPRHRRLNSVEFRNSREIRPLWLVERHGATKGETAEPGEPLPSLPSSKTSSRAPSMEDLRTLNDEDAIQSWDAVDFSHSMSDRRRPTGLTISTERANEEGEGDLLDSQQATPTAEGHGAKKEKHYEFHSPSELLQDPSSLPDVPPSPTMEALPSAEGSVIGAKELNDGDGNELRINSDLQRADSHYEAGTPTQEKSSFDFGPGFAGVVDAAVAAVVMEDEKPAPDEKEFTEPPEQNTPTPGGPFEGFADIVNAAVSKEGAPTPASGGEGGEPGTAVEERDPQVDLSKEVVPDLTEAGEPQTQPGEPTEEVTATSTSKKKKKKKAKKGPSQSADEEASEPLTSEGQAVEGEERSVESKVVPPGLHEAVAVQPVPAVEQTQVFRNAEAESLPAALTENHEQLIGTAEAAAASEPEVAAAPVNYESVEPVANESQPELAGDASAELNVPMTAAEKKKARKAAKKKVKKDSSIAEVGDMTQPSDSAVVEDVPAQLGEVSQNMSVPETPQNEQIDPEFHESRELVETAEPPSNEAPQTGDVSKDPQEPVPEVREGDLSRPSPAEVSEEPEALDVTARTSEEIASTPAGNEVQAEEDNFQEAVEMQAEQPKDLPSGTVPESTEAPIAKLEIPLTSAQKKKAKKEKKKRQSLGFDEGISTEPGLADPEPVQVPMSSEPEGSAPHEPSGTQTSLLGGEMLPSETESVAKDVSHLPVKELASVHSGDPEPVAPTESIAPPEPAQEMTETPAVETAEEPEAEPEVPMTAAQKKKAKKDKKKKSKQNVSSTSDDEKPRGPEFAETPSTTESVEVTESSVDPEVAPVDITTEGLAATEETPMEIPPQEDIKEVSVEPEQPLEEFAPMSVADVSEEALAEDPLGVPTEEAPEAPREIPSDGAPLEPEIPMTAAEKRKAKKAAKKKQQSISSIADEPPATEAGFVETPKDNEAISEAEALAAEEVPVPTPETEAIEPVNDVLALADVPVEEGTVEPLGTDQPMEDLNPVTAVEKVSEAVDPEVSKEPETVSAEPEVPMSAAERKKAKKAKKKQQSISSVANKTPAAETTVISEPTSFQTPTDIETAPESEKSIVEEAPVPTPETEAVEPVNDVLAPADIPVEEGTVEPLSTDQPKEADLTPAPAVETAAQAIESAVSKEESEASEAKTEIPMTAAEKKKAKKAKKQQQKKSVDIVSPVGPDQQEDEDALEAPQTEIAAPDLTESKAEATANVEKVAASGLLTEDVPAISEPSPELTKDTMLVTEETVPEPAPVDTPTAESVQEEKNEILTAAEPASDKSKEEVASEPTASNTAVPGKTVSDAAVEEPMAPAPKEDAPAEEVELPMTAAQKKKAKKDKKKRQSLAFAEESQPDTQPAPVIEEPVESIPAESSAEPVSEESAFVKPVLTSAPTDNVEDSAFVEQPAAEDATKDDRAVEQPGDEPEKSTEPEPEVPMTAAQRKKAKKEKKKRQSMGLEDPVSELQPEPTEDEPTPTESAPTEPAPTEPASTEPAPTEPASTEPAPTEPAPTEPAPTEPAPTEPVSTEVTEAPISGAKIEDPIVDGSTPEKAAKEETPAETAPEELITEPKAPAETAADFEVPMTAAQKKKAKKDKKKRQSKGFEEPQSELFKEGQGMEDPAEDAPIEPVKTPALTEYVESPLPVEGSAPEGPFRDIAAVEEPAVESQTPAEPDTPAEVETPVEAEPEDLMTAAQKKKAKKDKKKNRKSVSFEDEALPEQDSSVPAEIVESRDQSTADAVPPQELTEVSVDAELALDAPAGKEVTELETPTVDTTEAALPTHEHTTTNALVEERVNEPEADSLVQPEAKAEFAEEISASAEATESMADASLSAKERRKLKKKDKKKGKSVDLTDEISSPSTEEPPETQQPDSEAFALKDTEVSSPSDKNVAAIEGDSSLKLVETEDLGKVAGAVESDPAETSKAAEPDKTAEHTDQTPAAETTAELEPTPSKEEEPVADDGLSAKERRKLKKKQKRQSKNIDADDKAAEAEAAQDSPVPETAPVESWPAANEVEKSSPESDTREIIEPVTAPSPAENDGKELQSHDTETPDTPAQKVASTDEFLSSQVEQPQVENRSSDYPPQSVLERSIDFGDTTSGDAQEGESLTTPVPEEKVSIVKETPIGHGEGDVETLEEGISKDTTTEEAKMEGLGIMDTEDSVSEEVEVVQKGPDEESYPEIIVDGPASIDRETTAEDVSESSVSQKQKKKDKKRKQKQQQEEENKTQEESPVPGQVPAATETKEIEITKVSESPVEPNQEPKVAPTDEVSSERAEEVIPSAPLSSEENDSSKEEIKSTGDELAAETEQLEAPLQRRLSKKEKKKQQQREALLAQQAAEDLPETQSAPEPTGISKSVPEVAEEVITPAEEKFHVVSDAAAVLTTDHIDDLPKDISNVVEEGKPAAIQEAEQAELPVESAAEETADSLVPMEEPPAEFPVDRSEELPNIPKKMSKKEKKRAAAAAAAAAATEAETPAESKLRLDETSTSEPFLESTTEEALADASQHIGSDSSNLFQGQPAVEQTEPASVAIEETAADSIPEPQEDWPTVSKKMSKKEKKKAAAAGAATKQQKPSDFEQTGSVAPSEESDTERPKQLVPELESRLQNERMEASRRVDSEAGEVTFAPGPEQSTQGAEIPQPEQVKEATVTLGQFDMLLPTEQPKQNPDDFFDGNFSAEKLEKQNEEIEAELQSQVLEREADLEVAGDFVEDRTQGWEETTPVSKKLLKKEKRKAKKQGVESPLAHQEEPSQELISDDSKEVVESTTALHPELKTIAEPEASFGAQPEPKIESSNEHDFAPIEPQPAIEQSTNVELIAPEPVAEQPETAISRKASKKKAKKAKKAALALDDEPASDNAPIEPDSFAPFEPEKSVEESNAEICESITRELKQDEEEFPTIEWEHGKSDKAEAAHEQFPEPEPVASVPDTDVIGEFDESAIPEALQEAKKEAGEPVEDAWSMPLSREDKMETKKEKKTKRKSEQATLVEEISEEPPHKMVELAPNTKPEPVEEPTSREIETEPPARTTTPGGSKIANLFPGLERAGFRRSVIKKDAPSVKDSAEEETAADLEANRDIAIPVLEALPLATTEARDITEISSELPTEKKHMSTITDKEVLVEDIPKEQSTESDLLVDGKRSIADEFPSIAHPGSQERSAILFGSSPSACAEEETSMPRHSHLLPSQMEVAPATPSGLRRSPSVIHGKHQNTPRTWNLDDQPVQAVSNSSPPRSLFGPFEHDRPRTPLDTIAEHQPRDGTKATTARSGTPRLEIKPEHVLPRPVTPVRKFTDNALERKMWPTPENESGNGSTSQDTLSKRSKSPLQTPELGAPVLRPSDSKGKLRRTNRSTSSDLRAASRALDSPQPPSDLDQLPSSSSYDPVTDKGKRPLRNMSDVYVSQF